MTGKAEGGGRRPGVDSLPRTEITGAAHDLSKFVRGLDEGAIDGLKQRGTTLRWAGYGRFTVSVWGKDAPPSLRGHLFVANFDAERFLHTDLRRRRSRVRTAMQTVGLGAGERWIDDMLRKGEPVPDELAEELLDYLTSASP